VAFATKEGCSAMTELSAKDRRGGGEKKEGGEKKQGEGGGGKGRLSLASSE